MRRFGRPPERQRAYRHRPGAYAILPRDGKILLTWQEEPHAELQFPGGGIDAGEQPVAALHREVREETGWRIAAPRRLTTFRRFVWMPDYKAYAEKICHIFIARPILPLGPPTEEGHIAVWIDTEEALPLLANEAERAILQALR